MHPAAPERPPAWPLALVTLLGAAGYALTFLVAVHTPQGLHVDAALYRRLSGYEGVVVQPAGRRALETIDAGSLALGVLVLAFLALVRGRAGRAAAAAALVVCSVGSAELLKHALPHVAGAVPAGRPATFPSGHTAVAVSLGLGLVVALPPLLRATAAIAAAAYGAGIALSVVVLGWHYPSDVVGSFFLCAFWAGGAGIALRARPGGAAISARGLVLAALAAAAALAFAAWLAARHPLAVASVRSQPALLATAVALGALSVALFAVVTPLLGERPGRGTPSG